MKNIISIHNQIRFWLDQVGTPRYSLSQVDDAIDYAVTDEIDSLIGGGKYARTLASAELDGETKRILSKIITTNIYTYDEFTIDEGKLSVDMSLKSLNGVRKILALALFYDDEWHKVIPATREQIDTNFDGNVFDVPTLDYPERIYYIESENGLELFPETFTEDEPEKVIEKIRLSVVNGWEKPSIGVSFTPSSFFDRQWQGTYYAKTKTVTINGIKYQSGEAVPSQQLDEYFTSGVLVSGIIDIPFPQFYYNTIAQKAALILGATSERIEKLKQIFG